MKKEYIVELREEEADELMDEHWVGELVRCKDCAFRDDRDGMCEHVQQVRDPDWYCADGERRYGDDEVGMADIKETIQGLYALKTYLASKAIEEHGPARESLIGMQKVVDSAVNLLKEQEAVEPVLMREGRNEYYNDYVCPECDNELVFGQNFCSECGRQVKWNDT